MADVHARRYERLRRRSDAAGHYQPVEAFLNKLAPGLCMAVRYSEEPGLMMERMLLWPAGGDSKGIWLVLTPDGDMYPEDVSGETPNDGPDRVVFLGDGCLPPSAWSGSFYRFEGYPSNAELHQLMLDGKKLLANEGFTPLDTVPMMVNSVGARVRYAVPQAGQRAGSSSDAKAEAEAAGNSGPPEKRKKNLAEQDGDLDLDPGEGYLWIVAEPGAALPGGSEVALCSGDLRLGDKGLHATDDGEVVAVKRVSIADVEKEAAKIVEDARLLGPLRYDADGRRFRAFGDTVAELKEEPAVDFPLEGSRTTSWLMRYIVQHGGTPDGRHTKWISEQKIEKDSSGAHIHDLCGLAFECAIAYDQLDVANLASFEVIARLYQLIEETSGSMKVEGLEHYVGRGAAGSLRRGVALAPGLAKHTTEKLSQQTSILKERRKAREEAASAKAQAKKNSG